MPKYVITEGGKKYKVTVPEGTSKEQAYEYLQQHRGGEIASGTVPVETSTPGEFGIGMARGLAGDLQDAADIMSLPGDLAVKGISKLTGWKEPERPDSALRRFADEAPTTGAERFGRASGAALPFLFQPELGLGAMAGERLAGPLARFATHHGLAEMAQALGIPRAAAYRLLQLNPTWLERLAGFAEPYVRWGTRTGVTGLEKATTAGAAGIGDYTRERPTITVPRRGSPGGDQPPARQPGTEIAAPDRQGGRRDNDSAADQRP